MVEFSFIYEYAASPLSFGAPFVNDQNLVTADVRTLKPNGTALFAAFLNQKGRFIADAFLFGRAIEASAPTPAAAPAAPVAAAANSDSSAPAVDCILIDCAASAAPLLLAHLKQFKLRARLAIDDVSNECVDFRSVLHVAFFHLVCDLSLIFLYGISASF